MSLPSMRLSVPLCLGVLCLSLAGCFTGIESTPRISESDVRRADVHLTAEQRLQADIAPEPPRMWTRGKRWLAGDDKIPMIFAAPLPAGADSLAGRVLVLDTIRPYVGVAGDTLAEVVVRAAGIAEPLVYRPDIPMERIDALTRLELPFTVELSAVHTADSLLRGRTLYITTPQWRDPAGKPVSGLRHVAVRIDSVVPGTVRYPLAVMFTDPDGAPRSVMLTYGDSPAATRNFDRMFAFDDPRQRYPRITPETWDRIIHSRVADGMTRDECRLALGAPASINRAGNNAGQYERWNYDQGIYLIFEDGILIRYRL